MAHAVYATAPLRPPSETAKCAPNAASSPISSPSTCAKLNAAGTPYATSALSPPLFREPLTTASTLEAAIEAICSALALQPQDEDTLLLYQTINVFQARARTPHPRVSTLGEPTVQAPTVPEPEPDADHRGDIKCSTPTPAGSATPHDPPIPLGGEVTPRARSPTTP